jgi:hypothetical protein
MCTVLRVIATAHCLQRRHPSTVNHPGGHGRTQRNHKLLENIRRWTENMEKSGAVAGTLAASRTPSATMNFRSFRAPERNGSLREEASYDGRSNGYLGRGCEQIKTGPSTTSARVFSRLTPPSLPDSGTIGVAHE